MAIIAGVDGCKSDWLCITKNVDTGFISSEVFSDAQSLLQQKPEPSVVAVDIPIGLMESGSRHCDIESRKILGKRKSSVFPSPIRSVLQIDSYKEANTVHKQITRKGITKQTHAICKKILEFDIILSEQPDHRKRVKEVHPEVCFWAWNKKQPMDNYKKTTEGLNARRKLITDYFGHEAIKEVRYKYYCKDIADDDIHDAFAALWTAERILKGEARHFPENPPCDEKGLFMAMWY
jgi:predicted RNase H-like nuclease